MQGHKHSHTQIYKQKCQWDTIIGRVIKKTQVSYSVSLPRPQAHTHTQEAKKHRHRGKEKSTGLCQNHRPKNQDHSPILGKTIIWRKNIQYYSPGSILISRASIKLISFPELRSSTFFSSCYLLQRLTNPFYRVEVNATVTHKRLWFTKTANVTISSNS